MDFAVLVENLKREMCPMKFLQMVKLIEEMRSYSDLFSYIWSFEEVHKGLAVSLVPSAKLESEAEVLQNDGNNFYKDKRFTDALECYSQSILASPHPQISICKAGKESNLEETEVANINNEYTCLANGYINRSAALYILNQYDHCLADLELAENYTKDVVLLGKIKERREKCLRAKAMNKTTSKEELYIAHNSKKPPRISDPDKTVPVFSDVLRLEYTPGKGQHVVATRCIRPGELIAVEMSFCSRLYKDIDQRYCPVCVMPCDYPIPCPECCMVTFCSDKCRMIGLREHQRECKINPTVHSLGLGTNSEVCLALKILLRTTFLQLKDKFPLLEREVFELPPEKLGLDENGIFISEDYRVIYHMANSRRKFLSGGPLFTYCLLAVVLTKMLIECQTFFVDMSAIPFPPTHEDIILTGTALLHHLCIYPNVFCLSDVVLTKSTNSIAGRVVGDALFPALMMMRNSCNAPTVHFTFGHVRMVRATLPIAEGQEVTLCYTGKFQTTPLTIRRLQLEAFGIACSCEACENLWPCGRDVPEETRMKCLKCDKPLHGELHALSCIKCKLDYGKAHARLVKGENRSLYKMFWALVDRITAAELRYMQIVQKIKTGKHLHLNDFRDVCYYIELLHRHGKQPCMLLCKACDALLIFYYRDNKFKQ